MDSQDKKIVDHEQEKIDQIIACQNQKIKDLQSKLLNNKNKINDITLRALAKIENIKKDTKDNIKNIQKTELEKFLKTIMPIIDSLEDIVILSNALKKQDKSIVEGIHMTLQSLLNILYKLGMNTEGKVNEIFNPQLHTAIAVESSLKIPHNHIISVKKYGFTLNKVLLRKAIVTIAKK